MSTSAFKNAVRRREHYERHQPAARQRFGMLEKHKDYAKRAKNFHDKEKRISELRKKAANRNPDEFYFKMLTSDTKNGVHKDESTRPKLTAEMLGVLKTQDKTYVQTMLNAEQSKIEKLRATLHDPRAATAANNHIKFNEGEEDNGAYDAELEWDPLEDVEPGASGSRKRKRPADEADGSASDGSALGPERKARKKLEKLRRKSYAELEARQERAQKLHVLSQHMDVSRALLGKGRRVKIADANGDKPAVYMWKTERKR